MTRSNNYRAFMAYMEEETINNLKKFSKRNRIPMARVVREAVTARISPGDKYISGFNDGIRKAMIVVEENKATQMRFPSGKSFAELIKEDLENHFMQEGMNEAELNKED